MAPYSISKCIRSDKPLKRNGKYPIYFRITANNKETKISADFEVDKDNWDNKKKEPKDKVLANLLNKRKTELELFLNRALAEDQELTIDFIKSFNSGKKKIKPENKSFLEYFSDFMDRKRKDGLQHRTMLAYKTTYNALKIFKPDLCISEIDLYLIEDFEDHLRNEKGNASGGRNLKHQNLRTVILDMLKHDIQIKNPYLCFKMPKGEQKEIYLEREELDSMRNLRKKLSHSSTMYKVLQMYLFSCYCGLRYSDVIELRWNNLDFDNSVIIKTMRKTSSGVQAPLFAFAKAVLLELSDSKKLLGSDNLVFDTIGYPTVNKTLLKLTKMAKIEKHITFHSSRHTFATLLVLAGTDMYVIQKFLGHKTITTTERYFKYNLKIAKENVGKINTFC